MLTNEPYCKVLPIKVMDVAKKTAVAYSDEMFMVLAKKN